MRGQGRLCSGRERGGDARAEEALAGGLGVTAVIQLAVVLTSGSVALLAETIHNSGWRMPAPGGGRRVRTRSGHLG